MPFKVVYMPSAAQSCEVGRARLLLSCSWAGRPTSSLCVLCQLENMQDFRMTQMPSRPIDANSGASTATRLHASRQKDFTSAPMQRPHQVLSHCHEQTCVWAACARCLSFFNCRAYRVTYFHVLTSWSRSNMISRFQSSKSSACPGQYVRSIQQLLSDASAAGRKPGFHQSFRHPDARIMALFRQRMLDCANVTTHRRQVHVGRAALHPAPVVACFLAGFRAASAFNSWGSEDACSLSHVHDSHGPSRPKTPPAYACTASSGSTLLD